MRCEQRHILALFPVCGCVGSAAWIITPAPCQSSADVAFKAFGLILEYPAIQISGLRLTSSARCALRLEAFLGPGRPEYRSASPCPRTSSPNRHYRKKQNSAVHFASAASVESAFAGAQGETRSRAARHTAVECPTIIRHERAMVAPRHAMDHGVEHGSACAGYDSTLIAPSQNVADPCGQCFWFREAVAASDRGREAASQ